MKSHQSGVAIVEFAIAAVLFFTVLLGILEYGRVLFTWNSVAEATRRGARQAIVCSKDNINTVLTTMQQIVPGLTSSNVGIKWYDANGVNNSCTVSNCTGVSISVSGVTITPMSPAEWMGFSRLVVPGFSTYLPREIMGQDPDSSTVCGS